MLLISVVFVVFMVAGMPVAFATGIAGFVFFVMDAGMPLSIAVQKIASMSQSFPLLAVPFFVLAGHLMNASGITDRLLKVSMVAVGWMSGGLAQVAIVLSTLMGGVSGSAVADAAMEARILGPAMLAKGYGKGYSAAAIAVGSLITATIPPSIGLILYGYIGNVSIGRLFLAGIVPGFLMMAVLMATAYVIARRHGYVVADTRKPTFLTLALAAWEAKWAIFFPVALVLSIRGGVFTPSEVGSFAVVYALAVGFLAHRELTAKKCWEAFAHASSDVGLIMLIILMSGMVGFATIYLQVPQNLAGWMLAGITDPNMIVLVILLFLLVAGLALESTVMVLLLTPIFVPIVVSVGMDPVHFGILMMSIVTLGGMTWPSGSAMFAVCALMDVTIEEYSIASIPAVLLGRADPAPTFALAVAAWMRYALGRDREGRPYELRDPRGGEITQTLRGHAADGKAVARALFALPGLFPAALAENAGWRGEVERLLDLLIAGDIAAAIATAS